MMTRFAQKSVAEFEKVTIKQQPKQSYDCAQNLEEGVEDAFYKPLKANDTPKPGDKQIKQTVAGAQRLTDQRIAVEKRQKQTFSDVEALENEKLTLSEQHKTKLVEAQQLADQKKQLEHAQHDKLDAVEKIALEQQSLDAQWKQQLEAVIQKTGSRLASQPGKMSEPQTQTLTAAEKKKPVSPNVQKIEQRLNDAAKATQKAAQSAHEANQSRVAFNQTAQDAVKQVKDGAKEGIKNTADIWANGFEKLATSLSQRLRNPLSTGPATRAKSIMDNAFWTGAGAGGATHLVSRFVLEPGKDHVAPYLPGLLEGLNNLTANQQATALGGAALLASGTAAWLTGLMTSHGRDRIDQELAKHQKLGYRVLESDESESSLQTRRNLADKVDQFKAELRKEKTQKP